MYEWHNKSGVRSNVRKIQNVIRCYPIYDFQVQNDEKGINFIIVIEWRINGMQNLKSSNYEHVLNAK